MSDKEEYILTPDKSLTESQIFEKAKEDLAPIQENLAAKKITIDEAKNELDKINKWLQWSKIEQQHKKEIWEAFDKLLKLEKNIDENNLQTEIREVENLLEKFTQKELSKLKFSIKQMENRPSNVQKWIKESSDNLVATIDEASEDDNPIANRIGKIMKRFNS